MKDPTLERLGNVNPVGATCLTAVGHVIYREFSELVTWNRTVRYIYRQRTIRPSDRENGPINLEFEAFRHGWSSI